MHNNEVIVYMNLRECYKSHIPIEKNTHTHSTSKNPQMIYTPEKLGFRALLAVF